MIRLDDLTPAAEQGWWTLFDLGEADHENWLLIGGQMMHVLVASAGELSEGHSVTVLPSDALLTPSEVAELLGLSRPFVVRLLDAGDIPSERLPRSRHRKVRLADVLAFQARRERRRQGRETIADAVAAADLPY